MILGKILRTLSYKRDTSVEALKLHYWYAAIGFVCSSGTGTWSPEMCYWYTANEFVCSLSTSWILMKCATGIPSSNLFVVAVPVENKCQIWKKFSGTIIFFQFSIYIKNESFDTSGVSK